MPETSTLNQSAPLDRSTSRSLPVIPAATLRPGAEGWQGTVAAIRDALCHPGYFAISGALGAESAYPAVLTRMQQFFGLADDDPRKLGVRQPADGSANGWTPRFGEPAYQPDTLAHVESFDCGRPNPADSGKNGPSRPNQWPEIDGFHDCVATLWDQMTCLGHDAMRAVAAALELETEFLVSRCRGDELSTLRLLHYSPLTQEEFTAASVGISAHTDFECLTLIAQTAPGLELLDADDCWRDASYGPDRLIVLLGDMLERWTNGDVRATGHRVRPQDSRRFSIVRFFAIDDGVEVAPLPAFVTPERPSGYAAITQGEHTRAELDRAERYRDALVGQQGSS